MFYSGDGNLAIQAGLDPEGLAVGPDGSIYIVDSQSFRMDPDGIITTVAGNGSRGYSGDGGLATQAMLNNPNKVAVGPNGSIYISDYGNRRIRKVGPDGIISTVAGNG